MKSKAILSAFTGFLFGLIGYFVLILLEIEKALMIAVFGGSIFALWLFAVLIIYGHIIDKRYEKIEKDITSPVFYKTNGNFNLGNGKLKNGNIYFCEAGIVCICLEEKPYTLDQILWQDIEQFQYDNIHFNIITKDARAFILTTPDAAKIISVLRQKERI